MRSCNAYDSTLARNQSIPECAYPGTEPSQPTPRITSREGEELYLAFSGILKQNSFRGEILLLSFLLQQLLL